MCGCRVREGVPGAPAPAPAPARPAAAAAPVAAAPSVRASPPPIQKVVSANGARPAAAAAAAVAAVKGGKSEHVRLAATHVRTPDLSFRDIMGHVAAFIGIS